MGRPSSIWQKVAMRDAGPTEVDGDGDSLPVDLVVPTDAADALARPVSGRRVVNARRSGDGWSFAPWGFLSNASARPGVRVVSTEPHITALGAYGLVGVCATPVVLYEAWSAGRLPIGVSRTVRVHINGPVGPHVGVVDLVLGLVSDVGFDGYAGAVLEFQGDAVEGLTAHRRAALLAAASMTNCLTALTPLNEASLEHAKRLGMTSSLSLSEFARYRPDEEAAYRELAIVNADQTRPAAAWPRQGLVRPVAEVAGRQVDRIVVGGCVGGDHESLVELAIMVESDPVAKGIDFFAVAGSDRIRQQAAHSGTEARLASAGVRLVTPGQVPAGGQGRTVLTDNPCLDPSAIVVSLPTAVASAARKRLTSLGVGA